MDWNWLITSGRRCFTPTFIFGIELILHTYFISPQCVHEVRSPECVEIGLPYGEDGKSYRGVWGGAKHSVEASRIIYIQTLLSR